MLELTSAKQPSAEEQSSLNSLQAVFDKIDFDGSGSIEEDELAVALQDMGLASEPGTLNELFRRFAKTTPGSITFDEFVMIHQHSVSVGAERNSMFANLIGLELNSLGLEMPSSLVDLGAASRRLSANTAALFRSGTEPNPVANHAEESGEVYEAYIPTPPPATSRPTVHSMDDWNKASAEATLGGSPRISKVEARKFAHLGSSLDGPAPAPKRAVSFKEPTEEEGEDEEDGDQEEGGRGVKENETESPPNSADLGSEEVRALAPKGHPGSPGSFKMRRRPTSSSLTSEQTTRARLVFSRIDHDQSGGLDIGEVKLALQEMGAASDNATVTKMFEEFDTDGNGSVSFEEFKAMFAHSALGELKWEGIDEGRMARIEQFSQGIGQVHEGFAELAQFFRVLDKGMHFLRLNRLGDPCNTQVHLSPNRDALAFLFTASAACSLPFSALRAVAQPFRDEHDDTLGLVPPELADRCVVLVFGMLPEEDFALERARAAGAGKVEENNPVADAVFDVCDRVMDMRSFAESSDRGHAVGDRGEMVVSTDGEFATLKQCLTAFEPLALPAAPTRNSHSGQGRMDNGGKRNSRGGGGSLSSSNVGGSSSSGGGGGTKMNASIVAVGGKPMWSRGVLMLVAESLEAANFAAQGFQLAVQHHRHHALDPRTGKPRHVQQASSPRSPDYGDSDLEVGSPNSDTTGGRINRFSLDGSSLGLNDATKMSKHGGGFSKALQALHHLYRPHHHANHPTSRFHLGVECEVAYHATAYTLTCEVARANSNLSSGTSSRMRKRGSVGERTVRVVPLPCPVFRPHMYLRATIKAYYAIRDTYDLEYVDGPYRADETPDGAKLLDAIKTHKADKNTFMLRGVPKAQITVDLFDNYGSHWPLFVLLISALQVGWFAYWVVAVEGVSSLGVNTPVGGSVDLWLRVVSDFPACEDLSSEVGRFVTYQFVHSGLSHLVFNVIMQLMFGLPLNMVHGSLRFGLLYELGVITGGLAFVAVDGGNGSVVGCSAGVYCIFGMHLAEIVLNWSLDNKSFINHWVRLFVMVCVLSADGLLYTYSYSETVSYSAHAGGLLMGFCMGVCMLDTLETSELHRWFIGPLAFITAILLPGLMALYYWWSYQQDDVFPPVAAATYFGFERSESCCAQLLHCPGVDSSKYDAFYCPAPSLELYKSSGSDETLLEGCTSLETAASE